MAFDNQNFYFEIIYLKVKIFIWESEITWTKDSWGYLPCW